VPSVRSVPAWLLPMPSLDVLTLGRPDLIGARNPKALVMKIRNSLKTAKVRDKNCYVVRRRGRLYVLNKKNPRMKARQG